MQSGKILSIIADSGATTHCGQVNDPFIHTSKSLTKVFQTSLGQVAKAFEQAKCIHNVQEQERTVNIVPELQHNSLLTISKFADTNYTMVFILEGVQIIDGDQGTIASTGKPTF